jgi:hypothetical protein
MSHPPQPPPYDSGYGGQHGPPEPMYSVYQTSVSNTKRKATRASQVREREGEVEGRRGVVFGRVCT